MRLKTMNWLRLMITGLAFIVLAASLPTLTQAQTSQRCFTETGFCISGNIRAYWEQNGGLPVFGYPIGAQQTQTIEGTWTGPIQWFERDRLEDHGNEGKGVLAGRLGDQYLQNQGIDWQQLPGDGVRMANCRFFPETSRNLCGPFLRFWEQNGGLARFGYPITSARDETLEGKNYQVQYFERRRMEYHPENAGTSYEVLLGLLGRAVLNAPTTVNCGRGVPQILQRVVNDYRSVLGCPDLVSSRQLAMQGFEHGTMLWEEGSGRIPATIYVISYDTKAHVANWEGFPDYWGEGDSQGKDAPAPPAGKLVPVRGFGYLWRNNANVQKTLGFALAPEQGDQGTVLQYSNAGGRIIHFNSTNDVFVLKGDTTVEKLSVR